MTNEKETFRSRAEKIARDLSDPDFGLARGHSYLYDYPGSPAMEKAEGDKGKSDDGKKNID